MSSLLGTIEIKDLEGVCKNGRKSLGNQGKFKPVPYVQAYLIITYDDILFQRNRKG
jgi:hypothetical protein